MKDFGLLMVESYEKYPNIFTAIDILCIGTDTAQKRAAHIITALLGLQKEDGTSAVTHFCILAPPGAYTAVFSKNVIEGVSEGFLRFAGRPMSPSECEALKQRLRVKSLTDLRAASVIAALREAPEFSVTIVSSAADYRDEQTKPFVPEGAKAPLFPEDFWVPHLYALAATALEVARDRLTYVVLDTGHLAPARPEHIEHLKSLENCGVVTSESESDLTPIVVDRIGQWVKWVSQGLLGRALQDVDALPVNGHPNGATHGHLNGAISN